MGYVRDERTRKFRWVEDDVPGGAQEARRGGETSPTTWLLAIAVLLVVGPAGYWGVRAATKPTLSIRRIHNHPAEYDGREVRVSGRVGDVFEVGSGYAYYLLQDRDTIVVFTRGARPQTASATEVRGSVSIGYLDGVARPALFAKSGSD